MAVLHRRRVCLLRNRVRRNCTKLSTQIIRCYDNQCVIGSNATFLCSIQPSILLSIILSFLFAFLVPSFFSLFRSSLFAFLVLSLLPCFPSISFPEPANFLRCMLEKNEGSGKDQFLGDPECLSEMQYNTISPLFTVY